MVKKRSDGPRSGCPVSISLERFGDRWSLLIIRDLMVRGYRTFHEFQHAGEGIATNILTDRLRKLEAAGILATEPAEDDGRSTHYRLTSKGIALAPVILELLIWSARHEETAAPCAFIGLMEKSRETVLAEVRRRWEQRDSTPLIPPFRDSLPLLQRIDPNLRSLRNGVYENLQNETLLNLQEENGSHEAAHVSQLWRKLQRSL